MNGLKSMRVRYKDGCVFRSKVVVASCVLGPSAKLLHNRECVCVCASIMGSAVGYAEDAWGEGLPGGTSNRNSLVRRRDRPRVSVCVCGKKEGGVRGGGSM